MKKKLDKYIDKKGKTPDNYYFTQKHEDAVVQYVKTISQEEKNRLYKELLRPAFSEMVDKIVYTYKYTSLPNIEEKKAECKIWLMTILEKFDPDKGKRAFSYFTVITRNWFSHERKKQASLLKREVYYEDTTKNDFAYGEYAEPASEGIPYLEEQELEEFWESFLQAFEGWEDEEEFAENKGRQRVYEALKLIFSRKDDIEIFNKKAIYLYLREITGMNTKQIVQHLKKFRQQYLEWRENWNKNAEVSLNESEEVRCTESFDELSEY